MRAEVEEIETYVFNDGTGQLCRKGREAGIHETRCNRKSNQSVNLYHASVTIVTPRLQCDSSWSFGYRPHKNALWSSPIGLSLPRPTLTSVAAKAVHIRCLF